MQTTSPLLVDWALRSPVLSRSTEGVGRKEQG